MGGLWVDFGLGVFEFGVFYLRTSGTVRDWAVFKRWSRIFPYALTGASDTEVSSALPAGSKCRSRRVRGGRANM